ncbi:hypothetical protein [Paludisphaera rhizosphaerae]|uniref:hypothetical protein n=1 Tax=Paludisphaera rhizosphaerae TaxID=2711216 RepID=UPI0013EDB1F4|nr:hypothetical protein [Paludisphaera rhizosphaerae]
MRGGKRATDAAARFKAAMSAVDIEDRIADAVRSGCRLCGRPASFGGFYRPHSQAGRVAYIYALCAACERTPGSLGRIESMADEAIETREAARRKRKGGHR